ncbi:MAG: PPC domain-containing protein [Planctomycetota bacterium]
MRFRLAAFWSSLTVAAAVSGSCQSVALAQPAVSAALPAAVTPGKTVDVTLTGAKLDNPLTVWTSFPGKVEVKPLPADAKPGQTTRVLSITADPAAPVGIGGLMVGTAEGVSDVLLLLVDDLPSVADNGQNQQLTQPQELTLPVAVDGVSDGPRADYYRFTAAAGQRLAIEVVAGRLAQDYDPVLRLLDATGKEILAADDDPGLGADCRLTHTFAAAGMYIIEVRDNQYRGGGRYRLRVGDFPLVTTAYPLGVQAGTTAKIGFAVPRGDAPPAIDLAVPAAPGTRLGIGAKWPSAAISGLASVVISKYPEAVEAEPNNEPGMATAGVVPGGFNGRLEAPGDRDYFSFEAKKGQKLLFKAMSRSFGSPALVKFFVQKADGAALAESPVSEADEEAVAFTVPDDGSYRLLVTDLLKRGGPDFTYRVSVEPVVPFSLALKPDKATRYKFLATKTGGTLAIDVPVTRAGYDGPITLSVEGPGGAYTVFNHVIGEKQPATKLIVMTPATFEPGQLVPLKIIGKAMIDGQEVSATVSTSDLIRVNRPQLAYPPVWLDGVVGVSTAADQPPFYTATLDRPEVVVLRTSGQGEFNVKLDRKSDQFKDPLGVFITNGPAGFSFEVKRNGNGPQETYQVIVKGPAGAAEGSHPIKVVSYAELAGKGQSVVSADLPIKIVSPLTVTITPAGGLVFGNKQKVKLTVTRFATGNEADKQPVVIKFKKLPPGVTGPAEVTIPADQVAAEVELVAAADAPAGAINDVAVTATTKFQGQDITVESAPISAAVAK